MKLNQKGAIDLMLVAALVVILVVGGFVMWRINSTNETESSESPIASTQDETDSESDESEVETQTVLGDKVALVIPEGWEVLDDTESIFSITRQIGEDSHKILFQLESEDFLDETSSGVAQDFELNEMITLASGETGYIAKNQNAKFDLLACEPEPTSACSFKVGDKFMIVSLYQPDSQSVGELDMESQQTEDSLAAFKQLVRTLEIL